MQDVAELLQRPQSCIAVLSQQQRSCNCEQYVILGTCVVHPSNQFLPRTLDLISDAHPGYLR